MQIYDIIFVTIFGLIKIGKATDLISTYAKVAHWGANALHNTNNEGRSNGQSLWTHSSDVKIRKGQNLSSQQPVTYYYSMSVPSSKIDNPNIDTFPAKGEVQERFNPRPYFDFTFDNSPRTVRPSDQKKTNGKGSSSSQGNLKPPSAEYGSPINSLSNLPQIPGDLYDSPYSSYNPPNITSNVQNNFDFPPNNNQQLPSALTSYTTQMEDNKSPTFQSTLYGTPDKIKKPPSPSYKVPSDSSDTVGYEYSIKEPPNEPEKAPPDNHFHPPLAIPPSLSSPKKPLNTYPPMLLPQQGDPGEMNHEQQPQPLDYPYSELNGDNGDSSQSLSNNGPPITPTVRPPSPIDPPYLENPLKDNDHYQSSQSVSMAEQDLSPPPSEFQYGRLPQYLDHEPNPHDFYHFPYHNVYHEVHTPPSTTTAAPRQGPYSYYYLGRKLWYVPLYFSVYFIVYVAALILKSIARHKIQLSQNFDRGNARQFNVNYLNGTVDDAIERTKNMYM